MTEQTAKPKRFKSDLFLKRGLKFTLVLLALVFFFFLFYQHWFSEVNTDLFQQVIDHYAVFLLIPCAGFAALLLVVVFDEAYGEIKFSIWEFKFEGAAAPLIMYIICFLSIILSIKLLW